MLEPWPDRPVVPARRSATDRNRSPGQGGCHIKRKMASQASPITAATKSAASLCFPTDNLERPSTPITHTPIIAGEMSNEMLGPGRDVSNLQFTWPVAVGLGPAQVKVQVQIFAHVIVGYKILRRFVFRAKWRMKPSSMRKECHLNCRHTKQMK